MFNLTQYSVVLIIAMIFTTPVASWAKNKMITVSGNNKNGKLINLVFEIGISVAFVALFILSVAMIISDTYNPFLYFRF